MNAYRFNDLYIGLSDKFTVSVTEKMLNDFLSISNDANPLHVDVNYAKKKGFNGKVVYGMLTASFYSTLIGAYLPGEYCLLHGIEVIFNNPAYVGDILTVSGEVSYINEAYRQIEIKGMIINQVNQKISKAIIKVGINE